MAEATAPTLPAAVIGLLGTGSFPGDTNLGGGDIQVGTGVNDLQTKINEAINTDGTHKGHTLVVPVGVTYNPVTMPATSGPGWTRIRSASTSLPARGTKVTPSDSATMFLVSAPGSPGRAISIPQGSSGWQIIGCNAYAPTLTGGSDDPIHEMMLLEGDRIIVERCYVHANPNSENVARGILLKGSDIQIWDSWITDVGRAFQVGESQAIYFNSLPGSSRSHIEHCELVAQGENIMLNDQGSSAPAQDVTIKRCHFYKNKTNWQKWLNDDGVTPNPSWDGHTWVIKALFEVKWAKRLLLEGCVLENNWPQVASPGISAGQDGTGILINSGGPDLAGGAAAFDPFYRTNDVTIRYNTVINCNHFMSIQTVQTIGPLSKVAIHDNLGIQIPGRTFWNWGGQDIRFDHNTVVPVTGATGAAGAQHAMHWQWSSSTTYTRQTIRSNVFGMASFGLRTDSQFGSGPMTDALADSATGSNRDWRNNALYGGSGSTSLAVPVTGFTQYASDTLAGISVSSDPSVGGRLSGGSPLLLAGHDSTDIGADFTALLAAQDGTITDVAPTADFTATQTPGSYFVQFTNLSTGTDPKTYVWSGTDGFSSTQQNPTFTFTSAGTKTVTLTATNSIGSDEFTDDFQVTAIGGWVFRSTNQTTGGAGITSLGISPTTVELGDLIVVALNRADPSAIDSVTDTIGNTYTAVSASLTVPGIPTSLSRLFWTVSSGSATNPTITANFTGSTTSFARILYAIAIPLGTVTLVGQNNLTGSSVLSPMDSGSVAATSTDNNLLFGYNNFSSTIPTQPSGWVSLDSTRQLFAVLQGTRGTYNYQPTYTGNQSWLSQIVVFDATATSNLTLTATTVSYTPTMYTAGLNPVGSFTLMATPVFISYVPYNVNLIAVGGTVEIYLIRVFEFTPGKAASAVIRAQVPVANKSYYADSTYVSIHPFTTNVELASLRSGDIVEKLVAFPGKSITTDALYKAAAQAAQATYQAEISAVATSEFDGLRGVEETYDGTTWSS